jgi:hypothetical protein
MDLTLDNGSFQKQFEYLWTYWKDIKMPYPLIIAILYYKESSWIGDMPFF